MRGVDCETMLNVRVFAHIQDNEFRNNVKIKSNGFTKFVVDSEDIRSVVWFVGNNCKVEKYKNGNTTYYYYVVLMEDKKFKKLVERCKKTKEAYSINMCIVTNVMSAVHTVDKVTEYADFDCATYDVKSLTRDSGSFIDGMITVYKQDLKYDLKSNSIIKQLGLFDFKKL